MPDFEQACRRIVARYVEEKEARRLGGLSWEMTFDAASALGWQTPGELRERYQRKRFDPWTEPRR